MPVAPHEMPTVSSLLAARAAEGIAGAELLLKLLNQDFASMIEIVGKSGGNLLEFTGDALLVLFPLTKNTGIQAPPF